MRAPLLAIAIALLTTGCNGNVPEQRDTTAATASSADVSTTRPAPAQSAYVLSGGVELSVETATLVDVGTGCQYTVRTLYQNEIDLQPRNEPFGEGERQVCGQPRNGGNPFVTLAGGSLSAAEVAIITDTGTGCQEIVGTLFQKSLFATPRMQRIGDRQRQVCRRS